VKHDLPAAVDGVAAGGQQLVDVGLLDAVAAELDLDVGDIADEATRARCRAPAAARPRPS
jgi:hypothetical protein